jgi:Transglutaminase-like superfamily
MSFLVLRAYLRLIQFELILARENFKALHEKVRAYPIREVSAPVNGVEQICAAIDMACIWYWKQVLCLQRSAATACLLRRYGLPAHMMIGAQQMPFKTHAWVEVDSQVVNDRAYMREIYAVLDRC